MVASIQGMDDLQLKLLGMEINSYREKTAGSVSRNNNENKNFKACKVINS